MSSISQNERLKSVIRAMDSKLAEDIQLIGIKDLTIVADYFVIANGMSNTQTKAIADEVEFQLKRIGVDYGDIVVHVFYKDTRSYYNLERLWSDGEQCDIEQYLKD